MWYDDTYMCWFVCNVTEDGIIESYEACLSNFKLEFAELGDGPNRTASAPVRCFSAFIVRWILLYDT